ncbi:adenosylmethionine decarboxylase [Pelagicoccus sp. SDUM812003]|uniref:adenosylmethionine decarboxylase n=1 Tax=Pelagicoccus sp. SDUM812003 TaxID=3041267 RepID=UPI00280D34CD|nr:adenosylmethionine decarboxylase [Pelagicoccus sp. SDUM812003]MDQ8204209.1 adenosylmethionine decarboxylase [Pelagicoccus sp. SDUM812003]
MKLTNTAENQTSLSNAEGRSTALGTHILLELENCPDELLLDAEKLEETLVAAATDAGAHVVKSVFHQFNPHGLSGVVVIAESHIAVHTWPEYAYAAIDIFTCGDAVIAQRIQNQIASSFAPASVSSQLVERGPHSG